MFLRHKKNITDELAARWQALACNEHQLVLVRRTLKNGSLATVHQCTVCGYQVGSPLKKAPEHDQLPKFDPDVQTAYSKQRSKQFREINRELKAKALEEWKREYHNYLRSPQWAFIRQGVLERENFICQGCRKEPATQAHHTTYQNVGEEFLFELVALCRPCHERYHKVYILAIDTDLEAYEEDFDDGS